MAEGVAPEIYTQPYPHPYLMIWMECKRQSVALNGAPVYPEPSKGWHEQDADIMLAFEVFDELQMERQKLEEARDAARKAAQQFAM